MTKEDILKMTDSDEIIKAMLQNPRVVDQDVTEHQKRISREEHDRLYGSWEDIHVDFLVRRPKNN